jgi:lysylphosphatidylglycerol synthetase-like protein (DUF2156 family)
VRSQIERLVPVKVRAAALMPAAVLTVHQLRFQLAFGAHTNGKLAAEGHQYLVALVPLAAMLVAVAAGLFAARLARAWSGEEGENGRLPGYIRLTLTIAATLLAIYCCQELLEGFLSTGHPEGLQGVFGEGGWWAAPLSLVLGGVVALALRGAGAAIRWAVARSRRAAQRHSRPAAAPRPRRIVLPRPAPLAAVAAGRAPPLGARSTS